jgi:type I restriction enzyme M protein
MRSADTADLFLILIMARLKATGRAAVVIPDGFLFGGGNKAEIKRELLRNFNLHTIVRLPTSVFSPYTSIATNVLFFDGTGPTQETWFYRVDMPEGYKHFSKTKPMMLEHLADLDAWWNDRQPIEQDGADKARKYTAEELEALQFNFDLCGFPQEEEEILPPAELIARYQAERAKHEKVMDDALAKILAMIGGQA